MSIQIRTSNEILTTISQADNLQLNQSSKISHIQIQPKYQRYIKNIDEALQLVPSRTSDKIGTIQMKCLRSEVDSQ